MKQVEKTMDDYVRPMLRHDGGDAEIIDIKGTMVFVRLAGACAGCAAAGQTLSMLIEADQGHPGLTEGVTA
jgi:Fe-S cluster biogenesis protein NfuA